MEKKTIYIYIYLYKISIFQSFYYYFLYKKYACIKCQTQLFSNHNFVINKLENGTFHEAMDV